MKSISGIAVAVILIISLLAGSVCADPGQAVKFKDVESSDWYAEAVDKLTNLRIIDGNPGGSFNPKREVTRAEFVKMLVQAMEYKKVDSISFEDIKPFESGKAHWASVYIETALRNGVVVKEEIGNNFYPDIPVRRADMMMMLFKALKLQPSSGENPFADITEANGCFTKLYEEYLARGTVEGGKRLFKPEGLTTRAEAAVIIWRMVEYKDNQKEYVAKSAMEERFRNGTHTAEDIALKRQIEIAKAKADSNYIMEPIITSEINDDYKDYRWFQLYFDNYDDYTYDTSWKIECVNYKQLNVYEMPRPNGTFVRETITDWKLFGDRGSNNSRVCFFILGKNYYTTQALIEEFKLYSGMKIQFKLTVRKGANERVIYKNVELQ